MCAFGDGGKHAQGMWNLDGTQAQFGLNTCLTGKQV